MQDGIKPGVIMMIAGGAVMFISTLLDWSEFGFGSNDAVNGWNTDVFGLGGIFVALIGLVLAIGVAVTTFANVELPDNILGFSRNQIYVSLALSAFLISFGLQFTEFSETGVLLAWIAAAVALAGGIMEVQAEGGSSGGGGGGAPTQF